MTAPPTAERHAGTVVQFNAERAFGFVVVDGTRKRIFLHVRELRDRAKRNGSLQGARVEFTIVRGRPSSCAVDVVVL